MAKKVKKNTYWVTCLGEVFKVKNVYGGNVWGYGYSRQGTKNDEIEKLSVKDFLSYFAPCNVQLTLVIDKNGAVIHEECERILVNGE
mgnify:CR=1 FL=1